MRIESKKDLRLVGRAIREGWDIPANVRADLIAACAEVVASRDPELMFEAMDRLLKMDEVNIKRELVELKKLGDDNELRLRLLELARHIEPAEVAKLASQNGIVG